MLFLIYHPPVERHIDIGYRIEADDKLSLIGWCERIIELLALDVEYIVAGATDGGDIDQTVFAQGGRVDSELTAASRDERPARGFIGGELATAGRRLSITADADATGKISFALGRNSSDWGAELIDDLKARLLDLTRLGRNAGNLHLERVAKVGWLEQVGEQGIGFDRASHIEVAVDGDRPII